MTRWLGVVTSLLAIALGQAAAQPVVATGAESCRLEFAVDAGPGEWFNIIGFGYRKPPVTFAFSAPVFTEWVRNPAPPPGPAVTEFVLPSDAIDPDAHVFKWTFLTEDPTAKSIDVTVADAGCETSSTIDLDPYASATPAPTLPPTATLTSADPPSSSPVVPIVLIVGFASGGLMGYRRLARR